MQCYSQLTLPTAVTHAVSLPFVSASATNLIIAKTSLLQLFAFKSIRTLEAGISNSSGEENGENTKKGARVRRVFNTTTKFVLLGQYELSGTVTGLARIKTIRSKSGGEAVLVSLRDAKLALVEWDPEIHSIATVSIHYFEKEDLQASPWIRGPGQHVTHLAVDTRSRCVALKFGLRHMAILPFHQTGDDVAMEDMDQSVGEVVRKDSSQVNGESTGSFIPHGPSFVLSMLALDPQLVHPIHFAFLQGYREPT
jgi:cleavage and polyadenylation specificity factor subunit 1